MKNTIDTLFTNARSGITTALVSLPLSIPLALVSGVTPIQGIITAFWAGFVGALFGSSAYNIIGVTGALSGFVATYALANGPQAVPYLAIWAGIFIIIAYFLKLERYLVLIPSSVIHGFTLGIACMIMVSQLKNATGTYDTSFTNLSAWSIPAVFIFAIFLIVLIILRLIKCPIPGVLLITPIALFLGWLVSSGQTNFSIATLGSRYGAIIPSLINLPWIIGKPPIIPALVVAFVAILETLLSAKIADRMTHTRHNPHKEIFGLGLANIASGLMGGIPATAALARTAFNIKVGATHKLSALFSSLCIGIISLGFLSYFSYLPMPVIASILISVAIGMIEREHFARLYRYDKASFVTALLVAIITVYEDPMIGLLVGSFIALIILVHALLAGSYASSTQDETLIYSIKGEFVYLNSDEHRKRLERLSHYETGIILNLHDLHYIDLDGIESFDDMIKTAQRRHKKVAIAQIPDTLYPLLHNASSMVKILDKEGLLCTTIAQALAHLKKN